MRKTLYILFFISFTCFGQEKLELKPQGYEPIVTEITGKTAAELYQNTKKWAQFYYKNPQKVINSDIENEMIRIGAFCDNCFVISSLMEMDCDYTYALEIGFKDGKFRFYYTVLQMSDRGSNFYYTTKSFFKEDKSVRKIYKKSFETMNKTVNETYNSLLNYLNGTSVEYKKDW